MAPHIIMTSMWEEFSQIFRRPASDTSLSSKKGRQSLYTQSSVLHEALRNIPTVASPLHSNSDKIILPKWAYIKDRNGHYLSYIQHSNRPYVNLDFRSGDPNADCILEVVENSNAASWYNFRATNGTFFIRYYSGWYSVPDSPDNNTMNMCFNPIPASEGKVYLRDNVGPTGYFSADPNGGCPVAHCTYINESSEMDIIAAAVKNQIIDVQYDIPGATVDSNATPILALSTTVRNDSDSTVSQTLTYFYEKFVVGTWNNTLGVDVGAKITFEAGVPFVEDTKLEVSVSTSYSHQWGGQEGERRTVTSSTQVTVPPKKKAKAIVLISNANLDVKFTYTQRTLWSNGTNEDVKKSGVYKNIDSYHVDVQLVNWEDI